MNKTKNYRFIIGKIYNNLALLVSKISKLNVI